jgi:hypothetical protein
VPPADGQLKQQFHIFKAKHDSKTMTDIITYAVIAVLAVIVFAVAGKNKSKWGINLKRVYCPVCGTRQPIIRWPKNQQQLLWGGTTCPKCHTNLDKYGNIVP